MPPGFLDAKTEPIPREGDTEIELAPAGAADIEVEPATRSEPNRQRWREAKTEIDAAPPAALSGDMVLSGEISEPDPDAETNPAVRIAFDDERDNG